jgi:hypothetical protein
MSRLDREGMVAAATGTLGAAPDDSGVADMIFDKGQLLLAPELNEMKKIFKRAKKLEGYRWVMINGADLVLANTLSIGTKAGIITPDGKVLKNADIPRKKV